MKPDKDKSNRNPLSQRPRKPAQPVLVLALLTLLWTLSPPAQAADNHTEDDAFWAEAAKLLPAFAPSGGGQSAAPQDRDLSGEWSAVLPWPHIPVSAATLPDGRILTWSPNRRDAFPSGQPEFTFAATWNPGTGQFVEINHNSHDMYASQWRGAGGGGQHLGPKIQRLRNNPHSRDMESTNPDLARDG